MEKLKIGETENWQKVSYYDTEILPSENQRVKWFKYGTRRIPVYCHKSEYGTFTVSAGVSSDLSYTGSFYPNKPNGLEELCQLIDEKYKSGTLIK